MAPPETSDDLSDNDEPSNTRTAVDIALRTVSAVRDLVPLEAAKGPLSVLCSFLELIQTHWHNEDDLKDISERCRRVALIIEQKAGTKPGPENEDLLRAAAGLQTLVVKISKNIKKKQKQKTWRKFLNISDDAVDIGGLKGSLDAFIVEFQLETSITTSLDVRAILRWVQAQEGRAHSQTPDIELYTPPKPMIFCGRDELVKSFVNTLLLPCQTHIALIGPGGIGKTTISKAILNEEHIATMFSARLFITYDNVDYNQMKYETFISHIAEALQISTPTRAAILNRLKSLKTALLVIDNAETFIEAGRNGFRDISQTLDEMGTLCRIIFTTRNTDTVPTNLRWNTIYVEKLDIEAAVETFKSVYRQEDINTATKEIILELECHPLSINILASTAFSNKWSLAQLQINWKNQSKSRLLETRKDRYHSVAVAINLSVSCSDFNETRDQVIKLLRAVAFLPQGIHRLDIESIFQDDSAIAVAESLCRCSLANWREDRLVLLSPIRMYIAEQYNAKLRCNDELITSIRSHYYSRIDFDIGHCAREEYANLDRIFLFDISQKFVQVETLQYLWNFAIELYNHNPQPMSVWSALERAQSEVELDTFNEAKTEAMIWMSAIYAKMDHKRTSLEMIEAAKQFCRHMDGHKIKLAECHRDTGDIYRYLGKIAEAETCLREAHSICQELGDDEQENYVILCLSLCAIRKGDLSEATALLNLAENYFDPTSPVWATILLNKAQVGLLQSNFDQARSDIARAMKNEEVHHGGIRRPLSMLKWKASDVESRAGAMQAAEHILAEATSTKEGGMDSANNSGMAGKSKEDHRKSHR